MNAKKILALALAALMVLAMAACNGNNGGNASDPVSYTHLTLPTICSV